MTGRKSHLPTDTLPVLVRLPPVRARETEDVSEETLHRILDAAGDLYAAFGVTRVTISQVAGRAGVSKATVYRYVTGKQSLLELYSLREARALVERALGRVAGVGPESLLDVSAEILGEIRRHPVFEKVMADEPRFLTATMADPGFVEAARSVIDMVTPLAEAAGVRAARRSVEAALRLAVTLLLVPPLTVESKEYQESVKEFLRPLFTAGVRKAGKR